MVKIFSKFWRLTLRVGAWLDFTIFHKEISTQMIHSLEDIYGINGQFKVDEKNRRKGNYIYFGNMGIGL